MSPPWPTRKGVPQRVPRQPRCKARYNALEKQSYPTGSRRIPGTYSTDTRPLQMTKEMQSEAGSTPGTTGTNPEAQSANAKQANLESTAQHVGSKMQTNPSSVTPEDANTLESREHRATGVRPPTDSLSAEAKRLAAANEKAANGVDVNGSGTDSVTRSQQSALDKEGNFQEAAAAVGGKMASDPSSVTKEDAALLHSREQRAHDRAEKGGIAAQAERMVAENEGATKA